MNDKKSEGYLLKKKLKEDEKAAGIAYRHAYQREMNKDIEKYGQNSEWIDVTDPQDLTEFDSTLENESHEPKQETICTSTT